MNPKRVRLALLLVALGATAVAGAQTDTSSADTGAQQPGVVTIPPPIERTRGTTVVLPGRPNARLMSGATQPDAGPLNDQPAAVLPAPNRDATPNDRGTRQY